MSPHMRGLAEALEHILSELHPEHRWVVSERERDGSDSVGDPPSRTAHDELSASRNDADPVIEFDPSSTPGSADDDRFDEAA
jgi:hypothetical protein